MKKEIYIHIGLPKAGSSFLQERLFPELESQGIINFIQIQNSYSYLSRFVFEDSSSFDSDKIRSSFDDLLRPGINIISLEWLSYALDFKSFNTTETAKRIKKVFPDGKIILLLRNQKDFSYSVYKQHIHQGGAISLKDYFRWDGEKIDNSYNFEAYNMFDYKINWNSLFYSKLIACYAYFQKNDRLKILLFEKFLSHPEEFIADLLAYMEIDYDISKVDYGKINRGYGKTQINLARIINRFLKSPYNQYGIKIFPFGLKNRFQVYHLRRVLQHPYSFKFLGYKSITNERISDYLKSFYAEDNKQIVSLIAEGDRSLFEKKYF